MRRVFFSITARSNCVELTRDNLMATMATMATIATTFPFVTIMLKDIGSFRHALEVRSKSSRRIRHQAVSLAISDSHTLSMNAAMAYR
jgi:hypothetical protein